MKTTPRELTTWICRAEACKFCMFCSYKIAPKSTEGVCKNYTLRAFALHREIIECTSNGINTFQIPEMEQIQ